MLKGLTLTEFKEKFPQVSTYGLEDPLNVFLENGEILIEREWNGEKYILGNGKVTDRYIDSWMKMIMKSSVI